MEKQAVPQFGSLMVQYNPSAVENQFGGSITMRFLFKVSFPVEAGNAAVKKDGLRAVQNILEQQKPEAAYFVAENGKRTGYLVINMENASDIPAIADPWLLAFNYAIDVTP